MLIIRIDEIQKKKAFGPSQAHKNADVAPAHANISFFSYPNREGWSFKTLCASRRAV